MENVGAQPVKQWLVILRTYSRKSFALANRCFCNYCLVNNVCSTICIRISTVYRWITTVAVLFVNFCVDECVLFASVYCLCPSVVHASGSGQLQANPHVAVLWLSPGKPTRRVVTAVGSSDLVIGEDHMLGQSCQRYNWQTGRCGSIAWQLT